MDDYYIELGISIRQIRTIRGMSQSDLGQAIGVSAQTISNWENGLRKPTPENLDRIAQALRCTSDVFFHLQNPKNAPGARERAIRAIDTMTLHEREIMWYAFTRWNGDVHALLELVALYMALPRFARSEIVAHALGIMEDVGTDESAVQPDAKYLLEKWEELNWD